MLKIESSFAEKLPALCAPVTLSIAPAPKMVVWNARLGDDLGLSAYADDARLWSGSAAINGFEPIALAYAGHQFGGYSPRLGDGRAALVAEVINNAGQRCDIQWKGSGLTPFSRSGTDGKAALGPALREYMVSEAMHSLGVPTTRGLVVALTGERVYRKGNPKGAVLTRVATSHLRVGTFQYAASLGDWRQLRELADYAIWRHYGEVEHLENRYLEFLKAVIARQANLVARWMSLGFVHGVMNTDNMTISGETIDYGPCAFMEAYDPETVFSSIDQAGRYAYGRQPQMAQWNLARFAEAMLPLLDKDSDRAMALAEGAVAGFVDEYLARWLEFMSAKLGIVNPTAEDANLINEFLVLLKSSQADFTLAFRNLSNENTLSEIFKDRDELSNWLKRWKARVPSVEPERLNQINPLYIPRNHLVEEVIDSAEKYNDFSSFYNFVNVVNAPFENQDGNERYAHTAPKEFGNYVTYCGT